MVNNAAALRTLWNDKLSVTEYQKVVKPNKSTGFEEVSVLENEPCKLSFSNIQPTRQNEIGVDSIQIVKLFVSASVNIKPGSKLSVTRGNNIFVYSHSGMPGVFSHHQEIVLTPFEGWA
jgi:hypothetical protein